MVEVLERGDVQFFWRPSVQPADAETYDLGVQAFFLILSPAGGKHRRVRVGKKRMPSLPRERFWCRVERVGSLQRVLGDTLEAEVYSTKTRGERYQPAARPVARGTYELVRHDDHVHFRYQADPFDLEHAPEELSVPETGDHLILFENTGSGRAVWSQHGDVRRLDEDGYDFVIVGPSNSDRIESELAIRSAG